MAEPAWHADPTGRHQLRYFDGAAWTDHVSDNGVQSIDPVAAAPVPVQAAPVQAPPVQDPAVQPGFIQPETVQTSESLDSGGGSKLPWIIGAAVAVAVVIGLVFLVGGDDGNGSINTEGELAAGIDDVGRHTVDLKIGEPFRYRLEPLDPGMDLVLNIVISDSDARKGVAELAQKLKGTDLFSDTPFASDFPESADDVSDDLMSDMIGNYIVGDGEDVEYREASNSSLGDRRGRNDAEADWSLTLATGTYYFLVTDLSGDGGRYRLVVETTDGIQWTSDGVDDLGSGSFYTESDFYSDLASDTFSDFGS